MENTAVEDLLTFYIPPICPLNFPSFPDISDSELIASNGSYASDDSCSTPQGMKENVGTTAGLGSSTSGLHAKGRRKDRLPMVETEVRRSRRLLCTTKGFKHITCQNKSYQACNVAPPPVKSKVVKNLNIAYCKVNAKATSEEILESKRMKKGDKEKGAKAPKKA